MSNTPDSLFTKWIKKFKYLNIALIYLGTALVVIHFAEAVIHGLHMPALTFSLIVVLALAGLPIVLLIAWAMGRKKNDLSSETSATAKPAKRNSLKIITAGILSVGLFATAIFIYNKFFYHSKFTGKEKSIAVLPFTNMSSDKENEYFSDGMTDEITTQLSKIADLKVISRTSAMLYKGSKKSIRQIAAELGVASVLEGSVRKIGNDIRITAQLIDANTQEHIWANSYDREFKEVFAIQSEVAQEIAYQLDATLTKDERKRIEKVPTSSPEAYQYFLQAYQIHKRFFQSLKPEYYTESKALFEKALALDSSYALAHAGLADLYNTYTNHIDPDSALLSLQVKEIEKAYSLDPNLDYVHLTRAYTLHEPEEAFKSFRKALEINPNNADNLFGMAQFLTIAGLVDESNKLLNKAIQLNPLDVFNFLCRGENKYVLNKLDEAVKDFQTALQLGPDNIYSAPWLSFIYSIQDSMDMAKKMFEKATKLDSTDLNNSLISYTYAKLGNKKKALELAAGPKIPFLFGMTRTYLALGMKEEALKDSYIQVAMPDPKYYDYLIFKNHLPHKDFDIIRNDLRFLELMEKKRVEYEINKKKFSIAGLLN